MRRCFTLMSAAALLSFMATSHANGIANGLAKALENATWNLDARLRYEHVDDSVRRNAEALTLRTRLGYRSGDLAGVSLLLEGMDSRPLFGIDDFAPKRPGFAVIADPAKTAVNQALIRYRGLPGVDLSIGRQRLIFDNARHIGNVGWRQNEQTYDGVTLHVEPVPGLRASYAYLDQVNGVAPAGDANVASHLINLRYGGFTAATLTGYGYFLDDEDTDVSSDTAGVRFTGSRDVEPVTLGYGAEFARQESGSFDAHYWMLQVSGRIEGVTLELTREVLGSDGGQYGFQTPLATKHGFNGWADQFLTTPDDGLRDTVVTLELPVAGAEFSARHHWFEADRGGRRYGRELNLELTRSFGAHITLGLKYARYRARSFSSNTDKGWIWAQLSI